MNFDLDHVWLIWLLRCSDSWWWQPFVCQPDKCVHQLVSNLTPCLGCNFNPAEVTGSGLILTTKTATFPEVDGELKGGRDHVGGESASKLWVTSELWNIKHMLNHWVWLHFLMISLSLIYLHNKAPEIFQPQWSVVLVEHKPLIQKLLTADSLQWDCLIM